MVVNGYLTQAQSLSDHGKTLPLRNQKDDNNAIELLFIARCTVNALKFNFLLDKQIT
jgi:hypothetical protein